jgi:hypothetical protein
MKTKIILRISVIVILLSITFGFLFSKANASTPNNMGLKYKTERLYYMGINYLIITTPSVEGGVAVINIDKDKLELEKLKLEIKKLKN